MSDENPTPLPPDDPTVYSGITWSTNLIENLALQAYWNNRGNWDEILSCLSDAVDCLRPLADEKPPKDNCPWPTCDNGSCMPVCDK